MITLVAPARPFGTASPPCMVWCRIVWTTEMRYSQVHGLQKHLETTLPYTQTIVFPPKKLSNTGAQFIEIRQQMLQTWFAAVLDRPESLGKTD